MDREYKIIAGNVEYGVWTGPQFPNTTIILNQINVTSHCNDGCLLNIKVDPYEYENLAMKMPDMLAQMQRKLQMYENTYFNPDRGSVWLGTRETAHTMVSGDHFCLTLHTIFKSL